MGHPSHKSMIAYVKTVQSTRSLRHVATREQFQRALRLLESPLQADRTRGARWVRDILMPLVESKAPATTVGGTITTVVITERGEAR